MSNKDAHWGATKNHMIVTLVLWFFFSIVIFMFGSELNTMSFLGYPLAYYMTAQGSLRAFVIIFFCEIILLSYLSWCTTLRLHYLIFEYFVLIFIEKSFSFLLPYLFFCFKSVTNSLILCSSAFLQISKTPFSSTTM